MKFEVGQKWKTRDGSVVEITGFDQQSENYPWMGTARYPDGKFQRDLSWGRKGNFLIGVENELDLVTQIDDDFKQTREWVLTGPDEIIPGHQDTPLIQGPPLKPGECVRVKEMR